MRKVTAEQLIDFVSFRPLSGNRGNQPSSRCSTQQSLMPTVSVPSRGIGVINPDFRGRAVLQGIRRFRPLSGNRGNQLPTVCIFSTWLMHLGFRPLSGNRGNQLECFENKAGLFTDGFRPLSGNRGNQPAKDTHTRRAITASSSFRPLSGNRGNQL